MNQIFTKKQYFQTILIAKLEQKVKMFSWIISGQGETESSVHNFALKFIFRLPATIAITIIMFARIILLKGYPTSTLPNRPNVYVSRSGFQRQIGNLWPNIRGFCNSKHSPRIRVNCIKLQFEVKGENVYSRDLISDSLHIWHSKRELNYVNSFALTWEVDMQGANIKRFFLCV